MTLSDPAEGDPSPPAHGQPSSSQPEHGARRDLWNDLDQSSIMSVELMAAILVWGGIGHLLDRWLGSGPWLMGIGVLLGFGAGLYLVWIRSGREHEYGNAAARAGSRSANETEGR